MAEDVCPRCNGTRWITDGDGLNVYPCVCMRKQLMHSFLGPELSTAPSLEDGVSPLYVATRASAAAPASLDRTTENLFIKCKWPALLPHLKLAIGHRYWHNEDFKFGVETDERLFNVWVGNEHYKARSAKIRDEKTNYNSLRDLVEEKDLIIVRLGHIGHPNRAAAGVLKQALMIREVALKPTWVVENPDGEMPHSWSEEVAIYVREHFDVVDFTKFKMKGPDPVLARAPAPSIAVDEDEEESALVPEPTRAKMPSTPPDDPTGTSRAGRYKPQQQQRWKGRNSGSGGKGSPV
jgi:hypothetical protein